MLVHPQFNPIALDLHGLGLPIAIHWYGLTYLAAFMLFLFLGRRRVLKPWYSSTGWQAQDFDDLLFYGVLGVILGGRLGFVLFYQPELYLAQPLKIFAVWEGGMSFHGGLLGVIAAMGLWAWRRQRPFWQVMDVIAPCVPTGLACGRVGNFINGELWGRAADPSLPWAMVFPESGSLIPRHPSQVYQFLMEGLLLFVILWWLGRRQRPTGQIAAAFLLGYGVFRFIAEYFREPDSYLGLLSLGLSMGQWLCVPMMVAGAALWLYFGRSGTQPAQTAR
ncbi:prolipoprotein diacylglyceryl transferase [Amphibiibacter pelophylacis]|uniref:Prolipoprotein diacylglyceryl transferase n=1 Tax=Amphibiibacter pelophylacis TaxID=1799477 RepID=A0ACC6P4F8_9BURK